MTDPVRWKDDASVPEDVRALLSHGAAPPAFDEDARRAAAVVAASLAATAPTAAAAAGGVGLKLAIGLLAITAIGGGALFVASEDAPDDPPVHVASTERADPSAPRATSRASEPALDEAPPTEAAVEEDAVVEAPTVESPPSTPSAARPARAVGQRDVPDTITAAEPDADALAREAALLERARASVADDPSATLALVREHERDFPAGQLTHEREMIAIDALLRAGRRTEAERRADRFLVRYPRGIYRARVARMLDRTE
ncbi:MAG: hypothetical protein AB7S26_17095 [Sandaracinaceae bacterium]